MRTHTISRSTSVAALGLALLTAGPAAPALAAEPPDAAVIVSVEHGRHADAVASLGLVGADLTGTSPTGHLFATVPAHSAVRLAALPGVERVEADVVFAAAVQPDDTHWGTQWGSTLADFPQAWDITAGQSSTVIAVLDTGVDASHPDLAGAVIAGTDVVNGDDDPDDDHPAGHGTAVAGLAASRIDNGKGIAGACGVCTVMPVKVLDEAGNGTASGIGEGIIWAADHGADVINLSIAGANPSPFIDSAVAYARQRGIVVIAAAGNEGSTSPSYPAASSGVLGVAATDQNDDLYSWSNRGTWVDYAAPGCQTKTPVPGGGYGSVCGTSFAAPLVAGLVALALTGDHLADEGDIVGALDAAAVPIGLGVQEGRIDADDTLEALEAGLGRAAGAGRITTAIQVSQHAFPFGSGTVVVAVSSEYADALSAAPLAARRGAPILLVPKAGLTTDLVNEIRRLGASRAVIVGGTGAVPPAIETDLKAAGVSVIERFGGSSRFDTARKVAVHLGGSTVYVTEGRNSDPNRGWPDAVAVSGLAALTERPILLVKHGEVPQPTKDALIALGATTAVVVGGEASVAATTAAALSDPDDDTVDEVTVSRIAGDTRYHTSALLGDEALANGADLGRLWFATGTGWADALAAGAAVGAQGGLLLLVHGQDLGNSHQVASWLDTHSGYEWARLVGGESAITTSVAGDIDDLLG